VIISGSGTLHVVHKEDIDIRDSQDIDSKELLELCLRGDKPQLGPIDKPA